MSTNKDLIADICDRFNNIRWHDAKLLSLQLSSNSECSSHDVSFAVKLLKGTQLDGYILEDAKLTLRDCRIIKLDLDLLGKQLCADDIATAWCKKESALKEFIEREQISHFDLPQDEHAWAAYLHFNIQMIHPGGEINVFAKDFELVT